MGAFGEGGGLGFTGISSGELDFSPYLEGGITAGYSFGGTLNLGLEAAGGGREFNIPDDVTREVNSEFLPYLRLGFTVSGSFQARSVPELPGQTPSDVVPFESHS